MDDLSPASAFFFVKKKNDYLFVDLHRVVMELFIVRQNRLNTL